MQSNANFGAFAADPCPPPEYGINDLVRGTSILAEFAQAGEALLLYDMDVAGVGRIRVAEHFSVAGGRIARIRHVHDTAALRAAGFEPAEVSG